MTTAARETPIRSACGDLEQTVDRAFRPVIADNCPRCTGTGTACLLAQMTAECAQDASAPAEDAKARPPEAPRYVDYGGYRFARH